MSMHRLSGCPSCAEPLEEDDRFCGSCGHAVTTPPTGAALVPPAGAAPFGPAGTAPMPPAGTAHATPAGAAPMPPAGAAHATPAGAAHATPAGAAPFGPVGGAAHAGPVAPAGLGFPAPAGPGAGDPAAPVDPAPGMPAAPASPDRGAGDAASAVPAPAAGDTVAPATASAGPAGGVPATRGRPSPDEALAPRYSGAYAGEAAPGWGSVSTAAPTLVSGPTGWSGSGSPYPAPHPADPTPYAANAQGAAPYDGYGTPGPGDQPAHHDHPTGQGHYPGAEAPYAAAAPGNGSGQAANGPGGNAPYGGPAPQAHTPGGEAPYGSTPPGHDPAQGGTGPQGTGPGGEAPYGDPAGQGQNPGAEAPYAVGASGNGPGPQGHTPGHDAAYPVAAPQGDLGGKVCVACRAGRVDTDGYCENCGHAQPRERDHQEEELGSVAAVSDRGLRHHRNEDSFAVAATALPDGSAATVAIVCDGVSSASRPDEASAAAAGAANEALLDALPRGAHPQEAMHGAILAAAAAVNALAPEVPGAQNAPACTLVGAVVSRGLLTIGWVGDSRAYWVPDDRAALPRRLTEDDSWAAQMVAAGLMGEAEAYADVRAHAITGWLGADAYDLEPHTATFKPDHDGVVVVCTDGLWNYAESARDMAQVLPYDAAVRPLHSAQVLVGHALDGGGHDNVTVAVVPFTATPPTSQESPASPDAPQTTA
ncbi:protein phosphatase 2C domain-containing protein [Streptomyces sp. NPDC056773]|uniref:protein phosphatase 2C domain-containing protein n=1 Tax=unclassified Streptomyces TaxID=2593676 RepID=UPI0036A67F55